MAWRRVVFLIAALAMLNLACLISEISIGLVHQEDQTDYASTTISMHLTDKYIQAARLANEERRQDYLEAGVEEKMPADFPMRIDNIPDFKDQIEALEESGFQVVWDDDGSGFTAAQNGPLPETLEEDSQIQVVREDPEHIRYIFEVEIEVDEETVEYIANLDRLRNEGLGIKPELVFEEEEGEEKEEEEPTPGAELPTNPLFGGMAEGTTLDAWYSQRVMMESGWTTTIYTVELPGEIVVFEINGHPEGPVEGNRVSVTVDEAATKRLGLGKHILRVESVLEDVDTCGRQCSD